MCERELEAADLHLPHLELCDELVEQLLDGFEKKRAIDAFLA